MLNGSEKTDLLWQKKVMSQKNVKRLLVQARRYGECGTHFFELSHSETATKMIRALDLGKS